MTSLEWLAFWLLVLVSASLSASEVSLFSLSRFQIRSMRGRFENAHRRIRQLLSDPGGLLVTILVLNEFVNVSISTLVARAVARGWGTSALQRLWPALPELLLHTLVGMLITTPIVLFFCEITPKAIGARANTMVAPLAVTPLTALYRLLKPVRFVLQKLLGWITRLIQPSAASRGQTGELLLREEEFLTLVEEGHREGAVHESELDLIRNVFELDDTPVSEIMTPASRIFSVPDRMPIEEAVAAARGWRFSRILVTGPNRKQIRGILYKKDLLLLRLAEQLPDGQVQDLMRKPVVVNLQAKLNTVFKRLRQAQTHIAVVEDRHGNTAGIVTMHDVLDELFDDLFVDAAGEEDLRPGLERTK